MSQEISERLRGLYPKVKIYNASDRVQKLSFNSKVYVFPIGKGTEISGQDMTEKDVFGRQLDWGGSVPNPHATTEIVAEFLLREGRDRGLILLRNDASDKVEIEEANRRYVKATTREAKAIEQRWLKKVLDAKSMGESPGSMPEYVEQAQDFLTKNKGGFADPTKRFLVDIDGRSFHTKNDAKKHISARYPVKAAEWEKHVEDTQAGTEETEAAPEVA